MLRDIRYAHRWLRSNPGFTTAATLVLAVGIGATTATFAVVHAVLMRPLPFERPERIIRIWSNAAGRDLPFFSVSGADAADWRARAKTLALVAPYERQRPRILSGNEPQQVLAAKVSRELFDLLAVAPARGRWFSVEEDAPGAGARVVVISAGIWQQRFGGRADVIGQSLRLDGQDWIVIGVMPHGFELPNNPAELWLPLQLTVDPAQRSRRYLRVLARLRDGATVEQATSELERISEALAREHPDSNRVWSVTVRPLIETVVSADFRQALLMVSGAVAIVLLVACANVAGLLLSRGGARVRELAVRTALGASRGALVRQMLVESSLLALAGGGLGVLLAMWGLDVLGRLAAATVPRSAEIALRPAVMAFACGATTLTAVLFGIAPALRASHTSPAPLQARDVTTNRDAVRLRDALVIAEVALAMVLLGGATLVTRGVLRLQQRDLGFDPRWLLVLEVTPPRSLPPDVFTDVLRARLAALPGVVSVAGGTSLPFAGPNSANTLKIDGHTYEPGTMSDTDFRAVTPEYFQTLGIPLLRGRTLAPGDAGDAPATIISNTLARQFFAREDPIGRHVAIGDGPWMTIVGVAGDVRYREIADPGDNLRPMVYVLPALEPGRPLTIALRSAVPPQTLGRAIRDTVRALAPEQPVGRVTTMATLLRAERGPQQFNAALLGVFAWIALTLAATGLWGLIAYAVSLRTREIGVRVALGARPVQIIKMVAGRGVVLAAAGIAIGTIGVLVLGRTLEVMLFDVRANDPFSIVVAAAVFLGVSAAASMLPARAALRVNPVDALRAE